MGLRPLGRVAVVFLSALALVLAVVEVARVVVVVRGPMGGLRVGRIGLRFRRRLLQLTGG